MPRKPKFSVVTLFTHPSGESIAIVSDLTGPTCEFACVDLKRGEFCSTFGPIFAELFCGVVRGLSNAHKFEDLSRVPREGRIRKWIDPRSGDDRETRETSLASQIVCKIADDRAWEQMDPASSEFAEASDALGVPEVPTKFVWNAIARF